MSNIVAVVTGMLCKPTLFMNAMTAETQSERAGGLPMSLAPPASTTTCQHHPVLLTITATSPLPFTAVCCDCCCKAAAISRTRGCVVTAAEWLCQIPAMQSHAKCMTLDGLKLLDTSCTQLQACAVQLTVTHRAAASTRSFVYLHASLVTPC